MTVSVVVGNPRPASRTLTAATRLAEGLAPGGEPRVFDLVALAPKLLTWGDEEVAAAVRAVAESDLVVFASPTFKATYTGLLKLFLDQFAGGTGLAGVLAVPLMLGGSPAHSLAPVVHLEPVLVELGATTALPGLYLSDSTFGDDGVLETYVERWRPVVTTLTEARVPHPTR